MKKKRQMDNPVYQKESHDSETGTELRPITPPKLIGKSSSSYASTLTTSSQGYSGTSSQVAACTPEVCQATRQRYRGPDLAESPWHLKKTVYLLGLLGLFVIWIIVFVTLSQLDLL